MEAENKNIFVGGKDKRDPNYYENIFSLLKDDLQIMKRTWYFLDLIYPKTKEKYKCDFFYFERKYVNQVAEALNQLDFATISKIPHEKGGCTYQLEMRYLPSGDVFACQIIEARVGSDGGYFSVSPTLVLYNEEGKKAVTAMAQKLKKL